MKTNLLKIAPALIASVFVTVLVTMKVGANYLDLVAIGVSYSAVAVLIALTAVDYRSNVKGYGRY